MHKFHKAWMLLAFYPDRAVQENTSNICRYQINDSRSRCSPYKESTLCLSHMPYSIFRIHVFSYRDTKGEGFFSPSFGWKKDESALLPRSRDVNTLRSSHNMKEMIYLSSMKIKGCRCPSASSSSARFTTLSFRQTTSPAVCVAFYKSEVHLPEIKNSIMVIWMSR